MKFRIKCSSSCPGTWLFERRSNFWMNGHEPWAYRSMYQNSMKHNQIPNIRMHMYAYNCTILIYHMSWGRTHRFCWWRWDIGEAIAATKCHTYHTDALRNAHAHWIMYPEVPSSVEAEEWSAPFEIHTKYAVWFDAIRVPTEACKGFRRRVSHHGWWKICEMTYLVCVSTIRRKSTRLNVFHFSGGR